MASSDARNHHWIPQCYLKGFSVSRKKDDKLYVVNVQTGKAFETAPRNVAAGRDFNRVDIEGVSANVIESGLAGFEGQVDQALARICAARAIDDPADRNVLLNLIALLAVRNPGMRENMRQAHEQVLKQVIALTMETEERYRAGFGSAVRAGAIAPDDVLPYELMREFVMRDEYALAVSTTQHVQRELESVDTILPYLGRRNWTVLRATPDSGGFITSDHPVILRWDRPPAANVFVPPGHALRDTKVLFPVSHELAIIGSFNEVASTFQAGPEHTALINGVVSGFAGRQIYARDDGFWCRCSDGVLRRGADAVAGLVRRGDDAT